jgi:hypothetical protein
MGSRSTVVLPPSHSRRSRSSHEYSRSYWTINKNNQEKSHAMNHGNKRAGRRWELADTLIQQSSFIIAELHRDIHDQCLLC